MFAQFIIKVQIITPKCGQSVNVEYNIIPSIEILLKLWIIYFALNCAMLSMKVGQHDWSSR